MANDAKSGPKHSGGTKICTGCNVRAPSNSALTCKNCTMFFIKIIKVKSLVDLRGKGTKCCPNPGCNEPAKSNRALNCKLCKTPFDLKAKTLKRKASTTVEKKNKRKKTTVQSMEEAFQNDPLLIEDSVCSLFEPIALSRGSSLQEFSGLFDTNFDFDDTATFDLNQIDPAYTDDLLDNLSGAFVDEMTSAFTEEAFTEEATVVVPVV